MTVTMYVSVIVFLGCCVMIAIEKINKILIVLGGTVFFLLCGIIENYGKESPFRTYIDWNVIFLFIGVMLMLGVIKRTGLFEYIAIYLAKLAKGNPRYILLMLYFMTGVFSAFFDNITTMIFMMQISILIAVELDISPLPFIITQLIASTIGGTATLIGDPPNIMVGSAAGITFWEFLKNLALFVVINLIITAGVLYLFFKKDLKVSNERRARIMEFRQQELIHDKGLLIYTLICFAIFLALLLCQEMIKMEVSTIALTIAFLMIIRIKRTEIEHFINTEIEWGTILFFCCLFIMVGSLEASHFVQYVSERILALTKDPKHMSVAILWTSGIGSSLFNNVPFTASLIPMISNLGQALPTNAVKPLWWALILGASFGGNGSLIATTSNLVVADMCHKNKIPFSFMTFTKYGALVTVINLVLSHIFLLIKYY